MLEADRSALPDIVQNSVAQTLYQSTDYPVYSGGYAEYPVQLCCICHAALFCGLVGTKSFASIGIYRADIQLLHLQPAGIFSPWKLENFRKISAGISDCLSFQRNASGDTYRETVSQPLCGPTHLHPSGCALFVSLHEPVGIQKRA